MRSESFAREEYEETVTILAMKLISQKVMLLVVQPYSDAEVTSSQLEQQQTYAATPY